MPYSFLIRSVLKSRLDDNTPFNVRIKSRRMRGRAEWHTQSPRLKIRQRVRMDNLFGIAGENKL